MSKDLSGKYYQKNKDRLKKKKLVKSIKISLKKKKTKSNYAFVNGIKII